MARRVDNETLALCLLTSRTDGEAAEKVGMSKSAVCQRKKTREYQEAFSKVRMEYFQACTTLLVQASTEAVQVLIDMLHEDNAFSRYNAAQKILQLTGENIDREEILKRINAIEAKQEESEARDA